MDYPDIADRGVVWSYVCERRCSSSYMRSLVQLLSRIRINQLYLNFDGLSGGSSSSSSSSGSGSGSGGSDSNDSNDKVRYDNISGAKLCALDEACRRHSIALIPTLHLTNTTTITSDMMVSEELKNISSSVVCIVLAMDVCISDSDSISGSGGVSGNIVKSKSIQTQILKEAITIATKKLELMLRNILILGTTTVLFVSNMWCNTNLNITSISTRFGVDCSVKLWRGKYTDYTTLY